jgi:hypothetical protein
LTLFALTPLEYGKKEIPPKSIAIRPGLSGLVDRYFSASMRTFGFSSPLSAYVSIFVCRLSPLPVGLWYRPFGASACP